MSLGRRTCLAWGKKWKKEKVPLCCCLYAMLCAPGIHIPCTVLIHLSANCNQVYRNQKKEVGRDKVEKVTAETQSLSKVDKHYFDDLAESVQQKTKGKMHVLRGVLHRR